MFYMITTRASRTAVGMRVFIRARAMRSTGSRLEIPPECYGTALWYNGLTHFMFASCSGYGRCAEDWC